MKINCFTNGFAGQPSTVPGKHPRHVEWVYYQNPFDGVTIFEGGHAFEFDPRTIDTKYRVAWLTEAEAEKPDMYAEIEGIADRYDLIVTPSRELARRNPGKFVLMTRLGIRIPQIKWGGPGYAGKTEKVAMCLSDKMSCPGHRLRREIANNLGHKIDIFDGSYDRERDLTPYQFAVVVEVSQEQDFVTEHLFDVMALGCVPLYWGCSTVGRWTPTYSLFQWDTLENLESLIDKINMSIYRERYPFIDMTRLAEYEIPEDYMYKYILKSYNMV